MSSMISVPTVAIENGKQVKGTLSLFSDEYVFSGNRVSINWEISTVKKSYYTMKSFLRSVEKPCLQFVETGDKRVYVFEDEDYIKIINSIDSFVLEIRIAREKKLAEEKRIKELEFKKAEEEQIKRNATLLAEKKTNEAERLAKEQDLKNREEAFIANQERIFSEKKSRIARILDGISQNDIIDVPSISEKAASFFLDNPYRILGISCMASYEDANNALDKLKKLSRLNALASYTSPFDLFGLEKPERDLSIVQNALTLIKDRSHRWFWFNSADSCKAWNNGKFRIELVKDGPEYGSYDLFIANYLYALIYDSNITVSETWKRIFNYYCFIIDESGNNILRSRFTDEEASIVTDRDMVNEFKKAFAKPLLLLCNRDDLDAVIRLHNAIRECDNSLLDDIERTVISRLVNWFTEKESTTLSFLRKFDDIDNITDSDREQVKQKGEAYCSVVEPVLEKVLNDFRGSSVRYDMIKESYRHTTYQLMYILHKCSNKTDAIIFANRCYSYCKPDDKKRIQNTFGAVNIKSIDWSKPHTSWDIKGDNYYFGRGCERNYSQALYWYHKAADEGNMYSKNSLGLCYLNGNGVPKDEDTAVEWFRDAYDSGSPEGAYNLAECYYAGIGVSKNVDKALKYWDEAAKLGHPSASERRNSIFAIVQVGRKTHRSTNHICHDIGFQMTTGPQLYVEVVSNKPANAYLVNAQGYQDYLNGNDFQYKGGRFSTSPYRIRIPSSNRWYVIIDNGDDLLDGIEATVKVKRN